MTKPFSLAILRARVAVQLRKQQPSVYKEGLCSFDFTKQIFQVAQSRISLSRTEQRLLQILLENRGNTVPRERLLAYVWPDGTEFVEENALSVAVARLRGKLKGYGVIRGQVAPRSTSIWPSSAFIPSASKTIGTWFWFCNAAWTSSKTASERPSPAAWACPLPRRFSTSTMAISPSTQSMVKAPRSPSRCPSHSKPRMTASKYSEEYWVAQAPRPLSPRENS